MRETARTTVVAVVGGKGGTGRSLVAVNLAATLSDSGHRTALVDADLGNGACALLLGSSAGDVHLIAPPSHANGSAADLIGQLDASLEHSAPSMDYVVIDTSSGRGPAVQWALDRADGALVVVVDEPTAIADSYALVKQIWEQDPEYPLFSVVNLADSESEAVDVAQRFAQLTEHFLGRKIMYAGSVPFSAEIRRSVRQQRPAIESSRSVRKSFDRIKNRVRFGSYAPKVALLLN